MFKNFTRVLLIGFISLFSISGLTLREGFYSGLELGYSTSSYNANNVTVDIPTLGLKDVPLSTTMNRLNSAFASTVSTAATDTSNDGVGGRLYLGYKFYKILSFEAGYTRYADSVIKNVFQISSDEFTTYGVNQIIGTNTRVEQQSLDLSGKVFVPILDLFEVYGMVGLAYVDTFLPTQTAVTRITNTNGLGGQSYKLQINRSHFNNYEFMYGFGGGYSFDDRFIMGITYQQVQPQSKRIEKSSLLALDFIFSFG